MANAALSDDALRFLPAAQIVAVDNNREELDAIVAGLNRVGLPCVSMEYDLADGLRLPDGWRPRAARVIFLDLNLSDIELPSNSLAEPVSEVLKELAPASPYLLVLWTKHPDEVGAVMSRLGASADQGLRLPMDFITLDKAPFISQPSMRFQADPAMVKESVKAILATNKLFLALLAWESAAAGAAADTLEGLHSRIAQRQPDGRAQDEGALSKLLRFLASQAWGRDQAKESPGLAVSSALAPVLLDQLDERIGEAEYQESWRSALGEDGRCSLPNCVSAAGLNTHCLVDVHSQQANARGAWLEFTDAALADDSLWTTYFGCLPAVLKSDFFDSPPVQSDGTMPAVALGLLETTAACDFSYRNKSPLVRYTLGVRVPASPNCGQPETRAGNRDWKKRHDAIYEVPPILLDGSEHSLFLNFRYVLSLPRDHTLTGATNARAVFRVRRQVLTDIAARFAAHTTRPGLLAFHPPKGTSGG